jgi:hypothetical protein
MAKAILEEPDDHESIGSWTDALIQYVKDWLKEDVDSGDYTTEVDFMNEIGMHYQLFRERYLQE